MECIKFWCNFINERLYNSVDFHGFQEKILKNPEALFQKHFFYLFFTSTTSVEWLIWGLKSTAWVLVGQRGWKEPNTYFSAFFTTLDSSLEVEAAFTSLFLFSSPLSHVLLWERSIPPRFALLPLVQMQITQEKTYKDFIRKGRMKGKVKNLEESYCELRGEQPIKSK